MLKLSHEANDADNDDAKAIAIPWVFSKNSPANNQVPLMQTLISMILIYCPMINNKFVMFYNDSTDCRLI